MRILFFSHVYPNPLEPHRGTYNVTMLRSLAEQGHQVTAVSPVPWTTLWRRRGAQRALAPNGWTSTYATFYFPPKLLRTQYAKFMWHSIKGAARSTARECEPDVILSNWAHPDGEVATRLARELGVPSVIMVGGSDVLVQTQSAARRRVIIRTLMRADHVVTVSEDIRRVICGFGIDGTRVTCIYRGVDQTRFTAMPQTDARRAVGIEGATPVLLYVGNLLAIKGVDVLLRAAARLRDAGRRFHLYVAGDGSERNALSALCAALSLGEHMTFLGQVANDVLPSWYAAADLTVLASHSEGVPNVLAESVACGTPFVATRVGGIPEVASAAAGTLAPPNDPERLAAAVAAALDHPRRTRVVRGTWPPSAAESAIRLARVIASARLASAAVPLGVTAEVQC